MFYPLSSLLSRILGFFYSLFFGWSIVADVGLYDFTGWLGLFCWFSLHKLFIHHNGDHVQSRYSNFPFSHFFHFFYLFWFWGKLPSLVVVYPEDDMFPSGVYGDFAQMWRKIIHAMSSSYRVPVRASSSTLRGMKMGLCHRT